MAPPVTHGVSAFLKGKLSAGWRLNKALNGLKAALESEVSARRGEIDIYAASLIQSATRHEGVASLWAAHLKKSGDAMSIEQRLAVCREIRNATDSRDRCIEKLGLSKFDRKDILDAIYAKPVADEGAEHGDAA